MGTTIRRHAYFMLLGILLFSGLTANALTYDYSASIECLENPQKPQYGGGMILNPELNDGTKGWLAYGSAKVSHGEQGSNKFLVAHRRNQPHDSMSQKLYLQKDKLYAFSAWIQLSEGKAPVTAVFKTRAGFKHAAGAIVAESKCWSMLKGGLTVNDSGLFELYFESNDTSVEIWVDSISLQPFTQEQWRSHQDQSIEKIRKRKVKIQALDEKGNPFPNATIAVGQVRRHFPIGNAINANILASEAYKKYFISRFTVTTFVNEMKWYSTEATRGKEDYSVSDAMLRFCKRHRIAVRGHNVLWDDPHYQPSWVYSLSQSDLYKAVKQRVFSVMKRYKGQLIGWDVVNENMHFKFFESKLNANASNMVYNWAMKIDPSTIMYLNEYNTIEDLRDGSSTPAKYLQKLREIRSYPGNSGKLGIGLESHFHTPNLPYIRASLDTLGATSLPLWITELDVEAGPNQAKYLEQILKEVHGHPKVDGIVMWAPFGNGPGGCKAMCLTDNNLKNLPPGDVVDRLLKEWGRTTTVGKTDSNGFLETSLFHGDYEVEITNPSVTNSSAVHGLKVKPSDVSEESTLLLQASLG